MKQALSFKIALLVLSTASIICACGIKGRPLPPDSNIVITNEASGSPESSADSSVIKDAAEKDSTKTKKTRK